MMREAHPDDARLGLVSTSFGSGPVPDGEYEARIFPTSALFNVKNPIVGCYDPYIAVHYNGRMNVDKINGTPGLVTVKDGNIICRW